MESYSIFSLDMASLTRNDLKFIYFVAHINNFWMLSSIHCMDISYVLFIHSPIVGYLGCLPVFGYCEQSSCEH